MSLDICEECQYWQEDECEHPYHDDCVRRNGICFTPKENDDDDE